MIYNEELELIKKVVKSTLEKLEEKEMKIELKSNDDLVTIYDKTIENNLIEAIIEKYPNDLILSEETHQYTKLKDRCWIIDPIDGTTNFVSGLALYCVQVALYDKNELQLSYIYMPELNREYFAVNSYGAYLNGKRIYTRKTEVLSNGLISFIGMFRRNTQPYEESIKAISKNMKLRTFGSVGVELAFLAEGISLACHTKVKNIWDIAPGILLCKEAGAYQPNSDYKMGESTLFLWANKNAYDNFLKD